MSSSDPAPEPRWNCLNCRRRKVRCDRQWPCSNCVKGQRDCVFPTTGRAFRRAESRSRPQPRARQVELIDRIRRLERLVGNLSSELDTRSDPVESEGDKGRDPDSSSPASTLGTIIPASHGISSSMHRQRGDHDMLHECTETTTLEQVETPGNSRASHSLSASIRAANSSGKESLYLGERFWDSLRREVQLVRESFEDYEDDETDLDANYAPGLFGLSGRSRSNGSHFIFGRGGSSRESAQALPPQMLFIWQTYLEDVHPFVQVLHAPTVGKIIQDCEGRIEAVKVSLQPLMFAISLAAIRTLTEEEVTANFNGHRDDLLEQLRRDTEDALARADFINTANLEVVQALAIYIFIIATLDTSRYSWSMMGLLQRIAFSLDLHKDGSSVPGMSPFETEIRRRLWWQICLIEARIGNGPLPSFNIAERHFDTQPPTNANDADLDPDMIAAADPREGFTETSITLVRCEVWRMSQTVQPAVAKICVGQGGSFADVEKKLDTLRHFSKRMTPQSAKHDHQPMQRALKIMSRVRANSWELMINQLRSPDPRDGGLDDKAFALAVSIIKDCWEFQHDEAFKKCSWLLQGSLHWQGIAVIFSYIGSRPWGAGSEDAWKLGMDCLGTASHATKADPLWRQLSQLVAVAQKHRARWLTNRTGTSHPEPRSGYSSMRVRSPDHDDSTLLRSSEELRHQASGRKIEVVPGGTSEIGESYDGSAAYPRATGPPSMLIRGSPLPTSELVTRHVLDGNWNQPVRTMEKDINGLFTSPDLMDYINASAEALDLVDWNELVQTSGQSLLWGNAGL